MKRFSTWIKLTLFLSLFSQFSQAQVCGTIGAEAAAIKAKLLKNKAALAAGAVFPRSTQYVPIKFHVVQKSDGSGGILLRNVLEQLCALNNDFRSLGIQFYIKGKLNIINDDRLYTHHYNYRNVMETYRDPSAMNIWLVDNANPTGFDGYVAGYYTNSKDWLVIQKDEIKSFTYTLPHEVGHFFGLLHTFNGWDMDPWTMEAHGNPAPSMSPSQIPTERQDKSNCASSGDFICDTPPDYNFGAFWLDCNYNGGAKDPAGTLVNPDESNFMGYFDACVRSEYHFSAEQKSLMQTDIMNEDRTYVRSSYTPDYLQFSGSSQQVSPVPGSTVAVYTQVNLQWTPVDGANQYLIEISTSPAYTVSTTLSFITVENQLTVETLEPSKTYYWRIRPFNEYYRCTCIVESRNFRTGSQTTAVQDIQELNDWQASPNPLHRGEPLRLQFNIGKEFAAQLALLNPLGQTVQDFGNQDFMIGTQEKLIATDAMPAGIYLLAIQTTTGRSVKKIIIQ
ncbi:MAG: T9SS type A sorting domain-containing protein [Saprospiraceae bacterium]